MNNLTLAFLLTIIAGLSTGIGSIIALLSKKINLKFLAMNLGFSAGIMVYVSFVEILASSRDALQESLPGSGGTLVTLAGFFGGILLIALIDQLVPNKEGTDILKDGPQISGDNATGVIAKSRLKRTGLVLALTIAIHNFPEGLVTFVTARQDATIAIPIVIAIALHNIPEGITVSVPIYYATRSRKKAFAYSLLSGLAEPLGAVIGYLVLMPFMNEIVSGIIFAAVAGIMVFIAIDELLPTAQDYGRHHLSVYGFIAGMAVMALSVLLIEAL